MRCTKCGREVDVVYDEGICRDCWESFELNAERLGNNEKIEKEGIDVEHENISKEEILKELTGAYVMYFAFKNTSDEHKYFYAGEVKAIADIAKNYFSISTEEIDKIKERIKGKFDRIENRRREYENEVRQKNE